MPAGKLNERITFAVRGTGTDGYGNEESGFVDQFTVWAGFKALRGGEDVIAARLEGRQPVVLTLRRSSEALRITTGWRATDARGAIYNIRAVTPDEKRQFIDLLCEAGVAA
jgi:SPP1 family predicted phage head-tail adaptor